jgi:hypothetical protein
MLQTDNAKKYLLFEALVVTLALFFIELLGFFEKVKFWTRVYKGKIHDFSKLVLWQNMIKPNKRTIFG